MTRRQTLSLVLPALLLIAVNAPMRAADLPTTLTDPYLRIHVALADDKLDGVASSARALSQEAQKLGAPARPIAANATKLAAARDMTAARTAFGDLSDAMMAYAKSTGATFGREINVAYCPMAKKSWLQKGQAITNPYYGKSMLTCGEIKK